MKYLTKASNDYYKLRIIIPKALQVHFRRNKINKNLNTSNYNLAKKSTYHIKWLSKDLFIGFGTDFWGSALYINATKYALSDIEFLNLKFKILPLIITLLGAGFSFLIYKYGTFEYFSIKKSSTFNSLYHFFNKKWYFDRVYNEFVTQSALSSSYHFFYKMIDRGIVEKVGPFGIVTILQNVMMNFRNHLVGSLIKPLQIWLLVIIIISIIIAV